MVVAGTAAVVASASTLAGLASAAGWAGWTPWLLPAALDVGGCVGGWCWLRSGIPGRARDFGRAVALVGAAGTLVGNAAGHLIASGYAGGGPVLVVVVGAVPAAVLVALAHLATLLTAPAPGPVAAQPVPATAAAPGRPATARARRGGTRVTGRPGEAASTAGTTRQAVLGRLEAGPATVAELARVTGRSRSTIVGHLTALQAGGVVARDGSQQYRRLPHPVTEARR